MDVHKATRQLRNMLIELIYAQTLTNNVECINTIRRAIVELHQVADSLAIELAKPVDPMM